ncbi:hypothetical protein DAPPUDRAFT_103708 [Daphnia pulex]|uniref:Uncharacterized protein n=1 Tax=Daphnia pulex TaxID=6669 RepID=E9GJX9_DAPPU|nr:hypothetical protein DAPPUDRAFT_103708 [Daphnia pulex]|eukprot:EFX80245.1 hypothetical protein DAPPUDRAFT_103708 [Daphnia pulex]
MGNNAVLITACYLSIVFTSILTLNIQICDCLKPVTRGLLDLKDLDYCFKNHTDKEDEQKVMSKLVTYYVATKIQTDLRVEGLVCSQWIEPKKITGSFWIGSYHTEHFHTTKEVSPQECWEMKSLLNCAGNKNIVNGKTYSYRQKTTQDIEIRQESTDGPLLSPFGSHNVSLKNEHLIVNHNTIVWRIPNVPTDEVKCQEKRQFKGTGKISLIKIDRNPRVKQIKTGRILDTEKQVEILFGPEKVDLCAGMSNSYKIIGIPDTNIVFEDEIEKFFLTNPTSKTRHPRQLQQINNDNSHVFAWGHLNPHASFPPTEFDEKYEDKHYVSGYYCLTVNNPNHLLFKDCSIPHSTWIYDYYRMYIMETQSIGCLTAVKDQHLNLVKWSPKIKQMWRFDQRNTDYNLRQAYPNITIEEWEFVHEEFRSSPAENLLNIDHIFNWGQLMNKNKNGKTPMCMNNIHGKLNISMEPCQSQGDPMQFPDQLFEYDIDYTIRKFDTNHCLRINERNAVLEQCNPESMRWGANEITGQLMDVNSIKCIEFQQGKLRLGLCNDDQKPRHQKWKFEAYNPNLINSEEHPSLIPSRILEWHKNFSIHDMPFPTMPPIFQNRNNMSLIEDETIPETTPVPDTTTETNKEETTPVPDTTTETNKEENPKYWR